MVRREVLPPLNHDCGPSRRWWWSTQLCDCCGSRRVDDPLNGFVLVVWVAVAAEVACCLGSWLGVVLGVFLGESLGDSGAPRRRFPS